MQLIFATNNENKTREIKAALHHHLDIISLRDAGIEKDIPEPFFTLEENAREKAITIWKMTNNSCFAEDTGLEVDALSGEPGVRSARYAGDHSTDKENIALLLERMKGSENRSARFRTVVHLVLNGEEYSFEGICPGRITLNPAGSHGFGYDPVFIPDGSDKTFAEMDISEKNLYSHRKKAITKLAEFLNNKDEKS